MHHFFPVTLSNGYGNGTLVYWAKKPARKLCVFVHGFSGDPAGTWKGFPELLEGDATAKDADLLFFGYNGTTAPPESSARLLLDVLARFLMSPSGETLSTIPSARPASRTYRSVTFVCHSLGAVVVRLALLRAANGHAPWLAGVRLVLFAPAHKGAIPVVLARKFLAVHSLVARILVEGTLYVLPAAAALDPESTTLTELQTATVRALEAKPPTKSHLVAKSVIWARNDFVVFNAVFCEDPRPPTIVSKLHTGVCKPSARFRLPLEEVNQWL